MALERGQINPKEMEELVPSIATIVWSAGPLNQDKVLEFGDMVKTHYGEQLYLECRGGKNVDLL